MGTKKLWFKAKEFGWGWYPSTWQGWLILLIFIVLQFANFYRLYYFYGSDINTVISYLSQSLILTSILIFICYKTGEAPCWRWGNKK